MNKMVAAGFSLRFLEQDHDVTTQAKACGYRRIADFSSLNKCLGFGLIEVVIANFILVVGLLGLTGIVLNAWRRIENNYWHSLASSQLISLAEVSRVFPGNYFDIDKGCDELLPGGKCQVDSQVVRVCWQNRKLTNCLELPRQYEV